MLGEIQVFADCLQQERLLPVAQLLMGRLVGHIDPFVLVHEIVGFVDLARMAQQRVCLGVRVDIVGSRMILPLLRHDDADAALGPTTSFTKNATSLIIGPQPASYQPTEPSSNST